MGSLEKFQRLSDEDLAARARKGDKYAMTRLVKRFTGRVRRFAMVRGATDIETDEIISVTLDQMLRKLDQYRGASSFSTWVLTIARNHLIRLHEKKQVLPDCLPVEDCFEIAGSAGLEPDELARRESSRRLCQAYLAELTPVEREAVTLVWLDEIPMKEAALQMNKGLNAVSMALHRGVERLQALAANPLVRARLRQESRNEEETKR